MAASDSVHVRPFEPGDFVAWLPLWRGSHETNTSAMLLYDWIADRSGFVQYRKLFT